MRMRMFKFVLLFLISSCALFVERIDTPLVRKSDALNKAPETPGYCSFEKKVEFQLTGTNDNSQSVYLELVKNSPAQLDFLDHFALWNLLQLSIRPDQSSATSRFQVLMTVDDKSHYFDFFSEVPEDQYPFLFGIEWILKKFGKK